MRVRFAVLLTFCLLQVVSAQIDPRTAMLEQAGFNALNANQPQQAADAFRQALIADPRNARLHLGAGVAAWLQRRDNDAMTALQRALELDPALDEARQFLGRVQYRLGDLPGAIATYEKLAGAADSSSAGALTLDRWRRELDLQTRMRQAVGDHFTISFEGPAQVELANQALESLDRAYWRIGQTFGVYPASPVNVVLYTREQFSDITRAPAWAAAAYDGVIRVPMLGALDQVDELDRVLAHEFTHALIRTLSPRPVPTWLNEGLATALERPDLTWVSAVLSHGAAPSLADLDGSFGRLSGQQAEFAYAASAVAAARLLDAAGGIAVASALRDLGDGADLESTFARRMPWTFAQFSASLAH